jgi:maltokinase
MRDRLRRATDDAPALLPYAAGLDEAFGELSGTSLPVQRVHGDFHLGQTLHTPSGWKIIDFEGEPAKSLAERMAPDSVWRDLAGMLRSVDYAAASVPGPDSVSWAAECRSAFLESYARGPLQPGDAAILRAYEADKAIYEVIYEVRNRPDWVGIPLAAVATLIETEGTNAEAPPPGGGHRPTPASRAHERRSTDGIRSER